MKHYLPTGAAGILAASLLFNAGTAQADEANESFAAGETSGADPAAPNAPIPVKSHWETSAAAGATLTRGNSKTFLGTLTLLSNGKWEKEEANLGADFTYGENEDKTLGKVVKNAETEHAFGQFNRLFSERFFGFGRVDGLHDPISAVDYRLTLSAGAGYYFIKNSRTSLRGEVGPGYIFQKQAGHIHNYPTVRVADRFEYKFSETSHLWQTAEFLPEVEHVHNYIINAEIGVESALTKKLSLRTSLQDTYHNAPAPGREKNDAKLIAALAYKF